MKRLTKTLTFFCLLTLLLLSVNMVIAPQPVNTNKTTNERLDLIKTDTTKINNQIDKIQK